MKARSQAAGPLVAWRRRPATIVRMRAVAIRAVVFDIGDVLEVNPRTGWAERWASRLHMSVGQFEQRLYPVWASGPTGRATLEEIELEIAAALDLDDSALTELMGDVWAEYVGTLNHPLADYFARLRPRYKTGIVSNSFVGAREREQEAHGLGDICDVVVYSHEEGYLKPDPELYRITCDRLQVAPQHAVLLDDVEANVAGARAFGMHAITFRNNDQAIYDLEALLTRRPPALDGEAALTPGDAGRSGLRRGDDLADASLRVASQ